MRVLFSKAVQSVKINHVQPFVKSRSLSSEDGTPKLDLSVSGCTFCDDCAIACEFDVLQVEAMQKIDAKIEINVLECMSWHQTMCFSCKDPCAEKAIEFLGMFRPTINEEKCTNCGLCMHTCPVQAIKITA
jgi:ferredoxin-type protein NapF